jgi:hypothetical protein
MIRAAFSSLAGAWIARNVERGDIPERFALPLTLLAMRLPTPVILAGAVGYGLYRLNQEARTRHPTDISPKASSKEGARSGSARPRRNRETSRKPAEKEAADA